ncbi:MAG: hypothetical protein NC033_05535 [Clostridiales bacterium]|nr:hypothetical protein [Clostridiales bacterium]
MKEKALANEAQTVDNSAKEKKKNKTRKVIATTTYFIAMLCLLAGLFVPLFQFDKSNLPNSMMFRYLPSMFNGIIGKEIIKLPEGSYFLTFYGYTEGKFDFMSLIGVLYAVVCAISLLMLIPIFLGSKKKNTSARCALGVEVLIMLVTLTYIAYTTFFLVNTNTLVWTDYNFLLAFGGSLLMAIIQTVSSKGSIGVSKVIALLLSVLGVIALLDITMFIPKLATPLGDLSGKLKAGDKATFISAGETGYLGIFGINILLVIKDMIPQLAEMAQGGKDGIISLVVYILLILVAVLTVVNLIFDVIGLSTGKKYKNDRSPCKNGLSNTFALVRYILTIIFAAAIVILSFVTDGLSTGLYLWLLLVVLVISLVNAAVRTAVDNARYKKGVAAPTSEAQQIPVFNDPAFTPQETAATAYTPLEKAAEPAPEPEYARLPVVEDAPELAEEVEEPAYVAPDYMPESYEPLPVVTPETEEVEEPAPVVEPLSAPLEEPEEPTRTVYIYGGATDEFMDTLTDNEKVEFVELFIKKSKGTVNGVPDYSIDGDNSDFFPAVFVHINRYRNIVSDALMAKMYKQLGKIM